jgi:uncharacterized protein YndB with AHSA1/START domain
MGDGERVAHETLVFRRSLAASASRVFHALESAEARRRWGPPSPEVVLEYEVDDFRVGGRDVYWCVIEGARRVRVEMDYRVIARDRRLVFLESVDDADGGRGSVSLVTAELAPDGVNTHLTLTVQVASMHGRAAFEHYRLGWTAALQNLSVEIADGDRAPSLVLERVLRAPPSRVFELWAEPRHVNQWFLPKGFVLLDATMSFEPGGRYGSHMRSPSGAEYRVGGQYTEIVRDERICFTHAWIDEDGTPGPETVVTVTFEAHPDGTLLTFAQTGFESAGSRDSHLEGWAEVLEGLAAYLRGQM